MCGHQAPGPACPRSGAAENGRSPEEEPDATQARLRAVTLQCRAQARPACCGPVQPNPTQEVLMPRRTPFQQIPLFTRPACRLNRTQQLTLTTWRWARRTLTDTLSPTDLLPHVAIEAVRVALADVADPMALFRRHADAAPEFALVSSLLPDPD